MDNLEMDCEHIVQLLSTNEGINMDIRCKTVAGSTMQVYEAVETVFMQMKCEVVDFQKAQAEERSDLLIM